MRWIILFIVLLLLLILIPLIVYYYNFGSTYFSNDFKHWVEFSQFYILFVTLFNGLILCALTWKIHENNIALNKPILIFTINKEYPHHSIKNIGNGPAINIEIYHSKNDVGWDRKIKGLTLGKGEEFALPIDGQRRLGATYEAQSQSVQKDKCYMKDCYMRFENIESEFSQEAKQEIFMWEILPS